MFSSIIIFRYGVFKRCVDIKKNIDFFNILMTSCLIDKWKKINFGSMNIYEQCIDFWLLYINIYLFIYLTTSPDEQDAKQGRFF